MTKEHKHTADCGPECREAFEKMSDYVDKDLDSGTLGRLETHFSKCAICMMVLNTFKKTIEIFGGKGAPDKGPDNIPPEVSSRLHKAIRNELAGEGKK